MARSIGIDRFAALIAVASFALAAGAPAAEIEGVHFPERVDVGASELRLNGVGLLRYRVLFKGYVAALYLGEDADPDRVLEDVSRRLEIEYFWSIPAEAFGRATVEGVSRNVDAATLGALRPRIDEINALYRDVQPGDRYSLTYVSGVGTELALNGEPLGTVAGADFAAALFAIWLGDEPLDEQLRDQLLDAR